VRTAPMVLGALREAAYEAGDLVEGRHRIEQSRRYPGPEQEFVTAVPLAERTPGCPVIEILNWGTRRLSCQRRRCVTAEVGPTCLPLGWRSGADDERTPSPAVGPGEQLLFYTDGISEARDKTGACLTRSQ